MVSACHAHRIIEKECATKRRLTWKRFSNKKEERMPGLGRVEMCGRKLDVPNLHTNWC